MIADESRSCTAGINNGYTVRLIVDKNLYYFKTLGLRPNWNIEMMGLGDK
jgi:hypothetical protein